MDIEKTLAGLEALQKAMFENQCYACSHEFIDIVHEFGTNILDDAIELIRKQQKEIDILSSNVKESSELLTMAWEDHQRKQCQRQLSPIEYTGLECPECGKRIFRSTDIVFTTYPPKYMYKCEQCGWQAIGY